MDRHDRMLRREGRGGGNNGVDHRKLIDGCRDTYLKIKGQMQYGGFHG